MESFIFIVPIPAINRVAISRKRLELSKGRTVPIAVAKDDRNNSGFTCIVPFHRSLYLNIIAIGRGKKISADKQQNYLCRVQMCINFSGPFCPGNNFTVIPVRYKSLVFQKAEVGFKLIP